MRRSLWVVAGITLGLLIFGWFTANDLGTFAITILSGLFQGMLLFLVASGLSIVFGLMDVLNFAQGAYFMIGAYVSYAFHHSPGLIAAIPDPNLRFLLAVLAAAIVGALDPLVFPQIPKAELQMLPGASQQFLHLFDRHAGIVGVTRSLRVQ